METSADILDCLAGARCSLDALTKRFPALADDPEVKLLYRYVNSGIDSYLMQEHRVMTPSEVREFNENIDMIRNGGT